MDESFFDHIDSLLDFPAEDIDSVFPSSAGKSDSLLPSIWSESLPGSDPAFSGAAAAVCDLSSELSIPYEDIVQLEWLSAFVEDSFSGGSLAFPPADNGLFTKDDDPRPFQTSSPVSVLDSTTTSSCSGEKTAPCSPGAVIPGKSGSCPSKRPRPAVIQLASPENGRNFPVKVRCEPSEGFAESYNSAIDVLKEAVTLEPTAPKKKKKIKLILPPRPTTVAAELGDDDPEAVQAPVRKCLHCHITKTPQWRAGPLGPKTLCNACGVRYKSGRLFPEYRPAASPTFVPSLHSNSHKKVLEMRSKTGVVIVKDAPPELIPNTSTVVQMDYV